MIKTYISEQLVLAVKDRLRNVRYQIRRSALREASRSNRVGPIGPLVARPVALAADAVCSEVEAVAAAFMPEHERPSAAFAFPQPISAYFSAEAIDARSFTPEIYYALTGLLRRFGVDAFFVSEQAIDEALTSTHRRARRRVRGTEGFRRLRRPPNRSNPTLRGVGGRDRGSAADPRNSADVRREFRTETSLPFTQPLLRSCHWSFHCSRVTGRGVGGRKSRSHPRFRGPRRRRTIREVFRGIEERARAHACSRVRIRGNPRLSAVTSKTSLGSPISFRKRAKMPQSSRR